MTFGIDKENTMKTIYIILIALTLGCGALEDDPAMYDLPSGEGLTTCVFQDKLFVFGGVYNNAYMEYPGGSIFSSENGKDWELVSSPPVYAKDGAMWYPNVVVYNNKIWYMTGTQVWVSSDAKDWKCVNEFAAFGQRKNYALFVFNGKMWVMGGQAYDGLNNEYARASSLIWSSTDGVTWESWRASVIISYPSIIQYDGKLYAIGGGSGYTGSPESMSTVYVSTDAVVWTLLAWDTVFTVRMEHAAVCLNDTFFIIGGNTGCYSPGKRYDIWSTAPDDLSNWERISNDIKNIDLWKPLYSTVVYKGYIWIVNGGYYNPDEDSDHEYVSNIWRSIDGVNWTNP